MSVARLFTAAGLCLTLTACASVDSSTGSSVDQSAERAAAQRAPEVAQVARVAVQPETESRDDLICRREAVVGSHFRVRRCYTRAQLEEARRGAQEVLRESRVPAVVGEAE